MLRGSRDGFTPKRFHTIYLVLFVTFNKIKGTEEIIGGYDPSIWKGSHGDGRYGETKDSFIFAFKGENNFREPILSLMKKYDEELSYHSAYGQEK